MSLIVTLNVREGIVMAADSRLTLNTIVGQTPQMANLAVSQTDSTRKLFVTSSNVGISTCGDADIGGIPLPGFIDSFIATLPTSHTPQQVAEGILKYFLSTPKPPNTQFHIAGYNNSKPPNQELWLVNIQQNTVVPYSQNSQGVAWGGETDTAVKLLTPVGHQDPPGTWNALPQAQVYYEFFTLQDAIDFANYLIRTTIDTMRFQGRPKTVGGPIDILVIRPSGSEWINQKKLHL